MYKIAGLVDGGQTKLWVYLIFTVAGRGLCDTSAYQVIERIPSLR